MIHMVVSSVYVVSTFLFCIDTALFFLWEYQYLYGLLAYSALMLFSTLTYPAVCFLLMLCSLESFICLGHYGLSLIYMIPALCLVWALRPLLYTSRLQPILIALGCLGAQIYVVEGLLMGIAPLPMCTIRKFSATLIVTLIFSWKMHKGRTQTTAYS